MEAYIILDLTRAESGALGAGTAGGAGGRASQDGGRAALRVCITWCWAPGTARQRRERAGQRRRGPHQLRKIILCRFWPSALWKAKSNTAGRSGSGASRGWVRAAACARHQSAPVACKAPSGRLALAQRHGPLDRAASHKSASPHACLPAILLACLPDHLPACSMPASPAQPKAWPPRRTSVAAIAVGQGGQEVIPAGALVAHRCDDHRLPAVVHLPQRPLVLLTRGGTAGNGWAAGGAGGPAGGAGLPAPK